MLAASILTQGGAGYGQDISLVINEVMASNSSTKADPQGQYDDWIEIYNYGSMAVDAGWLYLTDNPGNPIKWQIPATDPTVTTIAPQGYLVIWADGDIDDEGLHADFKLSADGETVCLFDIDGTSLLDSMTFPQLPSNVSYGRYPDAGDELDFFAAATPGATNTEGYEGLVGEIGFSHEHGFYNEPFSLELTCDTPDVIIYYSLDGELPNKVQNRSLAGNIYTAPLRVEKTTCLRAVAIKQGWKSSTICTQTYIFVNDVVQQSPTGAKPGPGWPEPRASSGGGFFGGGSQVIDYGMDPDVVNDARYKQLMEDALLSIPSLSLVTPLANLFDSNTGIYVNALQDGSDWERPVSMELINPDGTEGFQIDAGLRIRGGYGRTTDNAKHAFRLFFRSEYGQPKLQYPLFEDEGVDTFDKVDLRCSQNYSWAFKGSQGDDNGSKNTMLREVFSRDLQGATGQPYTRSRYYHIYLNGQYWGIYETQERSEARSCESVLSSASAKIDLTSTGFEFITWPYGYR
jgi:hypothetical protein